MTTCQRVLPIRALLGMLAGLGAAAAVLGMGPKGCLVPIAVFLLALLLARPRLGLALTIVAAINLGHLGKLGATNALLFPSIAKLLGLVTLAGWLGHTLIWKRSVTFSKQMWAGAAFVGLGGFSVAYAQDGYVALADASKLVSNFVLYFLVANLIEKPRHVRQFALLLVGTGLIASTAAVLQYTQPQFQVSGDVFFKEFGQHQAGIVAPEQLEAGGFVRPTGTLEDPNWLTLFLVAVLALNCAILRTQTRASLKLAALIALAVELAALVMTHNRTGFMGMALVLLLLIRWRLLRLTAPLVALLSVVLALSPLVLPRSYLERVFSWRHLQQSASIASRWDLQRNGLGIFRKHWLLGVGQGNFGPVFMETNSETAAEAYWLTEIAGGSFQVHQIGAHNMYLEVAVETGVIGLILLLVFLGLGVSDTQAVAAAAAEQNDFEMRDLARAVQISLIAFCMIALFLHAQEQKIWWILAGLAAAMRQMTAEQQQKQTASCPLVDEPSLWEGT
ncbi:MAG: O-antigen ligase family protein [Sedimentisphaerales bacterium]|nr:O-antigen ligase family protein [Sedimentisphaerales bacterium]